MYVRKLLTMKDKRKIALGIFILMFITTISSGCISQNESDNNDLLSREDLNSGEWMPDGSYALIVGETYVWKYLDEKFMIEMNEDNDHPIKFNGNYGDITNTGQIYILASTGEIKRYSGDNAWNYVTVNSGVFLSLKSMDTNVNDDILIVGNYGTILTGIREQIESGTTKNLNSVSWNKNGSEAMIVGDDGTILLYKNDSIIDLSEQGNIDSDLYGVSWSFDGKALLVGEKGIILEYKNQEISNMSYKYSNSTTLYDVMWKPNGNYALLVGEHGIILKYEQKELTTLSGGTTNTLKDLSWKPDGSLVLIVGQSGTILSSVDGETFSQL